MIHLNEKLSSLRLWAHVFKSPRCLHKRKQARTERGSQNKIVFPLSLRSLNLFLSSSSLHAQPSACTPVQMAPNLIFVKMILFPFSATSLLVATFSAAIIVVFYAQITTWRYPAAIARVREPAGKRTFSLRTRLAYYTDCRELFREAFEKVEPLPSFAVDLLTMK